MYLYRVFEKRNKQKLKWINATGAVKVNSENYLSVTAIVI